MDARSPRHTIPDHRLRTAAVALLVLAGCINFIDRSANPTPRVAAAVSAIAPAGDAGRLAGGRSGMVANQMLTTGTIVAE